MHGTVKPMEAPMANLPTRRIDCTKSGCTTFRELVEVLEAKGFPVDHFHCVKLLELSEESERKCLAVLENGKFRFFIEAVYHLHLTPTDSLLAGRRLDGYWNCISDIDCYRRQKLDVDPRLFDKIVADEAHD